ncbi:hypothetical protein H0H92_004435 [Tricholoma furcatifolium]|nr:hypothetical protein H0H92_004435 [Tricholoma furcatifolium]
MDSVDSGSTTSGVTPVFAQVAKMRVSPLENPMTLQLGMIGSCSIFNYGAMAAMKTMGFVGEMYVCILGMPFMHQNKVVLNFDKKMKCPTVEDVVEVVQAVNSLPSSVGALLMTEEEYQATLLEREKVSPATEKTEKLTKKTEKTQKLKEKETVGKAEVKDEKPFTKTESTEELSGPQVLRDRPIPPPVSGLTFDPRMPPEWNEMVAALHVREEDKWSSHTRNTYRNATDDEISEPSEFEYSPMGMVTRLNVVDDTDVHLRALREKFEKNFSPKEQVKEPP